jgi:hypothetical protein
VCPVRYELGFYIQKDGILHIYRRENIKSDTAVNYFKTSPIFKRQITISH